MATDLQIAANRQNAQRSTGPRTEAGKAASSQNATRHGLAARGIVIFAGQESAFGQLESGLRGDLRPSGTLQEVLFKRILESSWNLERCRHAEVDLQTKCGSSPDTDPILDPHREARAASIHRYTREAENSLYKAMRELAKLQSEAQYRHEMFPITEAERTKDEAFEKSVHAMSVLCSLAQVMKSVNTDRRNEARTNGINTATDLKLLASLPPADYLRSPHAPPPSQTQTAAAAA